MHPPLELLPFQRRFLARAFSPDIDVAALSLPRGNGKTRIGAYLLARCLTPGDPLFQAGAEYDLLAASLDQARVCFRFIRQTLQGDPAYSFLDSHQRIGVEHRPTNTTLRVLSSNSKAAFGIVGVPLLVADEPGCWTTVGGQLMQDAIETAIGKPGSPLKVVYTGTIAPSRSGWWQELVESGSGGATYVQALQADPKKWDDLREVYRVNPLAKIDARFRKKLREERDEARKDPRLKARFLSYRLNVPSGDESTVLLTTDDWDLVCARPVPEPSGRSVIGLDMGSSRAWSSAVCMYENGRVEATAIAPGVPSLADQEKRDRVPKATYQRLVETGRLHIDAGLRVPRVSKLIDEIWKWNPAVIICDRFRLAEVLDAVRGRVRVVPRVWQWSSASEDIRNLRRLAADGPMSVDHDSRELLTVSLAAAKVVSDTSGNSRLVKSASHNVARDDVAAALTLAAGEALRQMPAEAAAQ